MLIRRTYRQRKPLLFPAALRRSSRLINRLMKASLIHPSDSIANMETRVKTYGMPWLHDNQWNEDLKSNSYLQLHFHGIDAHHFILEERKNIPIQKEDKHVTVSEILNCSSASGAKFHLMHSFLLSAKTWKTRINELQKTPTLFL